MTATAFALEPSLDFFDDDYFDNLDKSWSTPSRPDLRLLQGGAPQHLPAPKHLPVAQPTASVEMYRRRRFVALMAATIAVLLVSQLLGLSLLSFASSNTDSFGSELVSDATSAVHVVRPGDSYAAIAAEFGAPNPNLAAGALQAANGGSELQVGQRLVVDVALFESGLP